MDESQKKVAKTAGGALGAAFVVVALHPLILPAAVLGGGYLGYKAKFGKDKGPKQ